MRELSKLFVLASVFYGTLATEPLVPNGNRIEISYEKATNRVKYAVKVKDK